MIVLKKASIALAMICGSLIPGVAQAQPFFAPPPPRPPQNNQYRPNDTAQILGTIFGGVNQAIKNAEKSNNNNNDNWNNNRPQPGYYNYPTYQQPKTVYVQQAPAAAPAVAPAPVAVPKPNVKPAPTIIKANPNSVVAKVKSASVADLQSLKKAIGSAQETIIGEIEEELSEFRINRSGLIAEMAKLSVTVEDQTLILQSIKKGDSERAQILWTKITKDPLKGEELAHKIDLQHWYEDLVEMSEDGEVTNAEIRRGKRIFDDLELSAKTKKTLATKLGELETNSNLAAVIGKLKPTPGGATQSLPASGFTIIRNPKADGVCWLGDGYVMCPGGEELAIESNGTVCGAMGWPLGSDKPCSTTDEKWSPDGVLLKGPEGSGQVNYIVANTSYTISAGESQRLDAGTSYLITFFPGGKAAKKSYTLSDGTYQFLPIDGAWELQSKKYSIELNNRSNTNVFHAVVDNVRVEVPAGETKTIEGKYPLEVKYDRGNGASERTIRVDNGVFKIAVNPADSLWDIYAADQVPGGDVAIK